MSINLRFIQYFCGTAGRNFSLSLSFDWSTKRNEIVIKLFKHSVAGYDFFVLEALCGYAWNMLIL